MRGAYPACSFTRENDHDESHDRRERRIRHARPCARRTVARTQAAGPWRLIMPVWLLLLGLVLRPASRRTRRDCQAAKRELPIRLDVVRFLLCAERQHAAELPGRMGNIRFLVSAERQHAALGAKGRRPEAALPMYGGGERGSFTERKGRRLLMPSA